MASWQQVPGFQAENINFWIEFNNSICSTVTLFTTIVCKMENAQEPLHCNDATPGQSARIRQDVDRLKQNYAVQQEQLDEMSTDISILQGEQKPCQQHPMTSAELIEGTGKVNHQFFYYYESSLTLTTHNCKTYRSPQPGAPNANRSSTLSKCLLTISALCSKFQQSALRKSLTLSAGPSFTEMCSSLVIRNLSTRTSMMIRDKRRDSRKAFFFVFSSQ